MADFFDKQPCSRPIRTQTLSFLGLGASVATAAFGANIQHIRVAAETAGWLVIGDGTPTCTVQSGSMKISASQGGEYFAVTPGQKAAFNSTAATTFLVNITEMA